MKPERKARILVIDDEENIRKSLKMILEYEGYTFFEAADGEEGLRTDRGNDRPGHRPPRHQAARRPGRPGHPAEIKTSPFSPEVIMISGQGTIQTAVEATKLRGLRVPGKAPPPRPGPPHASATP